MNRLDQLRRELLYASPQDPRVDHLLAAVAEEQGRQRAHQKQPSGGRSVALLLISLILLAGVAWLGAQWSGNAVLSVLRSDIVPLGVQVDGAAELSLNLTHARMITLDAVGPANLSVSIRAIRSAGDTAGADGQDPDTRSYLIYHGELDALRAGCIETCVANLPAGEYRITAQSDRPVLLERLRVSSATLLEFTVEPVNVTVNTAGDASSETVPIIISNPRHQEFRLSVRPEGPDASRIALDTGLVSFTTTDAQKVIYATIDSRQGGYLGDIVVSFAPEQRFAGQPPEERVGVHAGTADGPPGIPGTLAAPDRRQLLPATGLLGCLLALSVIIVISLKRHEASLHQWRKT
ncbi:hypothetical protein COY28_00445 [Candidatus Woesearchaeota archaeon CG_4_10_14_0_2_um_filter_57_5]|nr:MAG: hypothetical protein AUJ68_06520 [Candidatus Woesearchaeota archaeon CG1_02_57_44]PIZ56941.1 MAG: hypothetical protein COY28_00445 [Candidatus Woesearchaeota archaeon CG_4_10_14_0_2_um_filter_57_5]